MSSKYPGGIISKTAPVPSGPYSDSTAPGIWTLEQQAAYAKLGQWPTAGNVNPNFFIENLFSTYLYSGTGASQNIVNGIDLSTNGGLVWIKNRTANVQTYNHSLTDTVRGNASRIYSNLANAANSAGTPNGFTYNSNGFTVGVSDGTVNSASETYVSWTFREQPKFFDVVTFSGNDVNGRAISHNLGSTPGFVMIKLTNIAGNWMCWHNSFASTDYISLNTTDAKNYAGTLTDVYQGVSSTAVTLGSNSIVNGSGNTYVMYVFAHNAGGFGLTGTDNVISCGAATVSGNATSVTLGYEPQWVMMKRSSGISDWFIVDNMRGFSSSASPFLRPNTTGAESANTGTQANATGFTSSGVFDNGDYIYIAIRRGPMAVPTVGTSVFASTGHNGTGATNNSVTFDPVPYIDLTWIKSRNTASTLWAWTDRLRGATKELDSSATSAETTYANDVTGFDFMSASGQSIRLGSGASGNVNTSSYTYSDIGFRRAPSFFDEVCYTGTGTYGATNHNLGVTPELVIYKSRSNAVNWGVIKPVSSIAYYDGLLNSNSAFTYYSNDPSVAGLYTSTQFAKYQDTSSYTYVAYLFATCAGVSKVGTYTGTGAAQTINCGFTGGSRFVLIKRLDSTGDWYLWDSARGIIPANDPYLLINSTAAEVTGTDYVDTTSVGFDITSTAPAAINANGGTFLFLAIA
jgi:hypothetical protein